MRWTSVSLDVKLHIVIVQGALTNYVIGWRQGVSKNITIGSHVTPMLTEWFCTGSSTHFKHIKLRFGCLLLSLSHRVDMPAALKTMKMFESTNGCYTKREDNFLHCQRMKVVSYFTFVRLFRLK